MWYLETGSNILRELEKESLVGVTLALVRCAWRWHGKYLEEREEQVVMTVRPGAPEDTCPLQGWPGGATLHLGWPGRLLPDYRPRAAGVRGVELH